MSSILSTLKRYLEWLNPARTDVDGKELTEPTDASLAANSTAFLDSIIENIPDMIFIKDAEQLRFVRFNRAGENLLGITRDQLIGRNDYDLFPKEQAEYFTGKDRQVLASGELLDISFEEIDSRTRGTRYLHTKKIPLCDASGRPKFLLGISEDVTSQRLAQKALKEAHELLERRVEERTRELAEVNENLRKEVIERAKAEEELRKAKHDLELASRTKDLFLAALSHELRTPLTPVLLAADFLHGDPSLPSWVRDYAQVIQNNIQLEVRLIDDLLDLTRVREGKLSIEQEVLDPAEVVSDSLTLCAEALQSSKLELECDLKPGECFVSADKTRLQQVIWNLVSNAIKFTPSGGVIRLTGGKTQDNQFSLKVIDTGIGIEEEVRDSLFNPFEQRGTGPSNHSGGLGLGLAIARGIMEKHGGTISVYSDGPGKGAMFEIRLPLAVGTREAASESPQTADIVELGRREGLKILLVEDHEESARLFSDVLRSAGHEVFAAPGVKEARRAAHDGPFDLLISDIGLKDGNGCELMREFSGVKVRKGIAVSGFGTQTDIDRSREAGFSVHLTKPVHRDQLMNAVKRVSQEAFASS